jgi:hypothetical protein
MIMGTKRVIVVGIVTLLLTILALTVPPTTVVNFLSLNVTIVVFFRVLAPVYIFGFLLELVSTWGRRLISGRWGGRVADFAQGLANVLVYMAPAEVAYILLFVAFAVNVPNGWAILQVLFLPGLFLLPFVFNLRNLRISIRSGYNWLSPKYRKSVERIKAERIPWVPILLDALYAYSTVIGGVVIASLIAPSLTGNLGIGSWVAIFLFFFVCLALSMLKWRRPIPPRQAADP